MSSSVCELWGVLRVTGEDQPLSLELVARRLLTLLYNGAGGRVKIHGWAGGELEPKRPRRLSSPPSGPTAHAPPC
eukprot:6408844-Alexandrium_andersonii.AAC.1